MQTATADPLVGRTLEGRYRILERIARGGMSTVYAAVDERLDRLVAVKVMSAALSADPAFTDRFSREARAAARLTHVNAVAVYDQGYESGQFGHHVFLVMELVQGRTLRELMRERGKFSPAEAISIMEPVLNALSAAHRAGLVHRDIKPENILLSDDGVVKVADFGLARAVETDTANTRTGLMMGTVAYCAPEQISKGRSDQRADVYSSGVVLFELLTGKPPYTGASAMNVAYQHVHSRVPAPSSRVKGVPYQIDELVVTATDSDPEIRPADAGEFLAQIADVRAELALPVVPLPARPRTRTEHRREPAAREAEARTAALRGDERTTQVVGGQLPLDTERVGGRAMIAPPPAADVPPPPVVIPPPKQRSERSRRRRRGLIAFLIILLLGIGAGVAGWWFASGRYSRVPDVRGQSVRVASGAIENAGYHAGSTSSQFSETVPKGAVIATDPKIGTRLPRGKTIGLVVSLGKDRVVVPDVRGQSVPDAQAAMQARGLRHVETQRSSESVPRNHVIGTDPAVGSKVKRDQVVKIVISSGPPVIAIPDIEAGTPYDQAAQTLREAGFHTKRVNEYSDDYDAGEVISISPTGREVKGTTITLTVSRGPHLVTVPEVHFGDQLSDVEAALSNAGLNYDVERYSAGGTGTLVLKISPGSGARVKIGSTVVITAF